MTGPIRGERTLREFDSYIESPTRANMTAVESVIGNPDALKSINGPLSNIKWDAFQYQYPSPTQEIIMLFEGGLIGALKATVTLNYTDSSKKYLSSGGVVI